MSYLGPDPAGPFEKCAVCGDDIDITKSYDHRECIPKVQVPLDNHTCGTCRKMLWDCNCPASAVCVECDLSVEDIDGPACLDAKDGVHVWRVPDGDGFKVLR